jgi:integrase
MARVVKTEGPRGPRWSVHFRRPDGSSTTKRFPTAGAAREFATKVEHDKRTGTYIEASRGRISFEEMTRLWLEVVKHADTTAATVRYHLEGHVFPVIGDVSLAKLEAEPLTLLGLRRKLQADLAPNTVRSVWGWVAAVFNAAVLDKRLTSNPAKGLRPPKPPRSELVPLEGPEVEALVAALPVQFQGPAILAKGAGLRLSEALAFGPYRIDWAKPNHTLHVARQIVHLSGQTPYLRLPKGDKDRRVPVGPSVTEPLQALLSRPRARAWDEVSQRWEELAFASIQGQAEPLRGRSGERCVEVAARKAGLPAGTRFHDLRHYYAATLIAAGLSEREVGLRLGHSSAQVTATYGHLFTDADQRTRDAVEAQFERVLSAGGLTRRGVITLGEDRSSRKRTPTVSDITARQRPN